MKRLPACFVAAIFSSLAYADFYATGKIEASECSGIVIKTCRNRTIHAVKDNGQMYEIKTIFARVSEYNKQSNRCWVNTKTQGIGITDMLINAVKTPDFYERKPSGEYEKVDADYVTFKCEER